MMRFALVMMILAIGCAGAQTRRPGSQPSEPAIDFVLPKLGGGQLGSGDLRGQVVLLDFWATWCAQCRESLPFYQGLADAYGRKGLRVVAVSVDSDTSEVRRFVAEQRLTFDVLSDSEGALAARLDLPALPTLLLLDRDGNVVWKHVDFKVRDKDTIKEHIHAALGK